MSAILFLQDVAQIAFSPWMGWTGAGVLLTGAFTIHRMISSQFDKKVDKDVFAEHKEADEQAHKSLISTMESIDDNVKMLLDHQINKK